MNIKNKISKFALAAAAGIATIGCTGDFAELNTNPKSLTAVAPEELFYTAEMEMRTSAEYWNASASKGRWMRYGMVYYFYGSNTTFEYVNPAFGDGIYSSYNAMGGLVTNIGWLADNHENAAGYAALKAMTRIMLISKAIYTSDMWGSLAYSEAWQSRAGKTDEESLLPRFQTQQELSEVWNAELKAAVQTLSTATGQVDVRGYDRAYAGDVSKWIKAGNALRLRLASRLLKREPATAKAIAAEVLGSAAVMGSPDDSFIFWFDNLSTGLYGNDWHSPKDLLGASVTMIDYFERNADPRMRMMFRKNGLTPEFRENWNKYIMSSSPQPEGYADVSKYDPSLPADSPEQPLTFKSRYIPEGWDQYEGATCNPLERGNHPATGSKTLPKNSYNSAQVSVRPANAPQVRLFKGSEDNGAGGQWYPVMTHADFCFLAAEFVLAEGVSSSKTAQQWYEEGVKSSLDQWNAVGKYCDIYDYTAMTSDEISTFLAKPDIAWASDAAKQLEQIRCQAWVDNFKNYDESWAQWKRTGMPNTETTVVNFEKVYYPAGVELNSPRRAKFTRPTEGVQNYENLMERLNTLQSDPDFGELNYEWGRLWWDKK